MPTTTATSPLPGRLAALRQRWRFITITRGGAALMVSFLLALIVVAALDWLLRFPDVIRAFLLVGILAGLGLIFVRLLIRPLAAATDDLSLALRIEEHYPELNDGLASAVQFLEATDERDGLGAPAVRRAAVRQALLNAESCDFRQVIPGQGGAAVFLALVMTLIASGTLLAYLPDYCQSGLLRLADPFGDHGWPAQTRLVDLTAPQRLARGEPFLLQGLVEGVVPQSAVVRIQVGRQTYEQAVPIRKKDDAEYGTLAGRVERDRVQQSFRYQVQANDAVSRWQDVTVLPPPLLVALDGRPSPQADLRYPAYTDLPPLALADGSRLIATVAGTRVRMRGAADRPVARAWMQFSPEYPSIPVAASLLPLAGNGLADVLALSAGGQAVWGRIPAQLERQDTVFTIEFVPWLSGTYALRLEDETRIGSTALFQINVAVDPSPKVFLERPSASRDSLFLLPDADITLQVAVEDVEFAVRSVFLEYRCQKEEPARRLTLYHHEPLGRALGWVGSGLARSPLPAPRLRPPRVETLQRLSLKNIRQRDGSPLKEGDIVTLVACADDFDNVAVDKPPGRSHEIELRIVNRSTLEALVHQAQAQIQQELLRLRELERKALNEAATLRQQEQATGKLDADDLKRLTEILDQQKQIRDRIGDEREGLRAQVERALQALRDNHLPRGGAQERLEMVDQELDRLARDELERIESQLINARKEHELRSEPMPATARERTPLAQAAERQAEVERTLEDLLARLDAWSNSRQARAEAKAILQEQHKLAGQTARLPDQVPAGTLAAELTPEQQAELQKAAEWQRRLAEHAGQLLQKMERVARDRLAQANDKKALAEEKERLAEEKKESEEALNLKQEAAGLREEAATLENEAQALQKAAQLARDQAVEQHMRQAADQLAQNQVGNAGQEQKAGAQALEQVVQALEDRREKELDSLIRKLKNAEQELARLVEDQEKLRKKVQEAQALADPKKREAELKRLAREQEQLRKRAQDMTRQLSRLQAERAREALGRANERMGDAGMQLDRNEDPGQDQEDALDRLDDALAEVQEALERAEDELAREKLAKVEDQLKQLKERQESLLAESARIQRRLLENQGWDRIQQKNLLDLSRGQAGLQEETSALADGKLANAKVFARILKMAAEAMTDAARAMEERVKNPGAAKLDVEREQSADRRVQDAQKRALQRLDQLLEALKQNPGLARQSRPQPMGQDGNPPGGAEDDGIPETAELKAMKALQVEINQRTEAFARKHPDVTKLDDAQKQELDAIRNDQRQVHDLIEALTPAAEPAPMPKGEKP